MLLRVSTIVATLAQWDEVSTLSVDGISAAIAVGFGSMRSVAQGGAIASSNANPNAMKKEQSFMAVVRGDKVGELNKRSRLQPMKGKRRDFRKI